MKHVLTTALIATGLIPCTQSIAAEPIDEIYEIISQGEGMEQDPEIAELLEEYDGYNMEEIIEALQEEQGILLTEEQMDELYAIAERAEMAEWELEELPGWELMEEHLPELVEEAYAMEDADEKELLEYREELADIGSELEYAEEQSPELLEAVVANIQANFKIGSLEDEYHEAESEEQRAVAREALKAALSEAFEVSQRIRELEARQIEEELKQIRVMLEERRENKNLIIDRRLAQLTQGLDPYEW